jgi:RNA polymerase sigma-70 factor (ECF subfamily)
MQTTASPCLHVKPTTPAEAGEKELAARVASGDASALEAVIEQYGQRVIGLAARLLGWTDGAEDVAQDVFVQVLHKGKQFRGQASLWTWLATLTVNRCRSIRRRRWLQDRMLGIVGRHAAPEAACPISKQQERSETATRVRAQVAQLPAAAREVIVLRYFEELPLDEIAAILGIKRNAIEARLSRARKQLEPLLRQESDIA